jgi:hypothetical protein
VRGLGAGLPRLAARLTAGACLALAGLLSAGCVDTFLEPEPGDGPVTLFQLVWEGFDRHYSYFGQKELDWDAVRVEFGSRVTPETTEEELFGVLSDMLLLLEDGHVNLYTPTDTFRYTGWYDDRPRNYNPDWVAFFYMGNNVFTTGDGRIRFGTLGQAVGYVHVGDFGGEGWIGDFDEALLSLESSMELRGLVLDIRDNPGGTDSNIEALAGRFTDRKRLYRYYQYRNGPEHDDFTELTEDHIEPRGLPFRKPVVILTNRRVFSAAEDFILAMRTTGAMVVGDTTGGGFGNPMGRELPNGWTYRLSRWREWTPEKELLVDGEGLVPDEVVVWATGGLQPGVDPILERGRALVLEMAAARETIQESVGRGSDHESKGTEPP